MDIYALGISLLSMARGYRFLVDEKDQEHVQGHQNSRLTCCKEMGTYTTDTISNLDNEKLMKDIPVEYRLPERSDFVVFISKMLCNVDDRFSAKQLLMEYKHTWLRIESKYDESKKTTTHHSSPAAAAAAAAAAAPAARTTAGAEPTQSLPLLPEACLLADLITARLVKQVAL